MKTLTPIVIIFMFSFAIISCGGSDDTPTEPPIVIDPDPIPGKTSTYNADVKPIIDSNCLECHGDPLDQSAPMMLITYQQVVSAVRTRDLYRRIFTSSFTIVMPPFEEGGRLPNATVLAVEDWIADGLLEE